MIDAEYDPDARAVRVTQRLTLTNRTGAALSEAVLCAWSNAYQSLKTSPLRDEQYYDRFYPEGFSSGMLVMSEATVTMGGESAPVAYRYTDEAKTVLSLPLPAAWESGVTIELALRYTVTPPKAANRFGVSEGICALGNAFLIPAAHENGAWRTDAYTPIGDPFVSDCFNYTVTVRVPSGYQCAGTGTCTRDEGGDSYRFEALAVRDFALAISERYAVKTAVQDGVLLQSYARDGAHADAALATMKRALACYNERFGAYPYPTLTCAEICFPLGGMEYPQLVMISAELMKAGGEELEYAVAHEVAHQWWYAVVGSDSVNDAWQDEALCEFSALEYWETAHGRGAREDRVARQVETAMRLTVAGGVTPGAPIDYFDSIAQYATVVYNRGSALFLAMDTLLDGGLDSALRAYYAEYAFRRATREEFEALLNRETGEDLTPLMLDYLDTLLTSAA